MGSLSFGRVFWLIALLLLLAAPLLGLLVHRTVDMSEYAVTQRRFEEVVGESTFLLEKQMTAMYEVLAAVAAFFDSSEYISRQEFNQFTQDALKRHTYIRALEWVPEVPRDLRSSHELRARNEGLTDYRIRDIAQPLRPSPEPADGVHFPVFYMEPLDGNQDALGLDLATDSTRYEAIQKALHCDDVVLSDPVDLVQGDGSSPGILAFRRVHNEPGLVLLVFEIETLVEVSLAANPIHDLTGYDFVLVDVEDDREPRVLHSHTNGDPSPDADRWRVTRTIDIGGRHWRLSAVPTQDFLANHQNLAGVAGVGSSIVWTLLWMSLISVTALSRSRILRRKDLLTHSVLSNMSEGVVVADEEGQVVMTNQAALSLLRMSTSGDIAPKFLLTDGATPCDEGSCPLQRVVAGDRLLEEIFCIRNDKDKSWLAVNGTPLANSKGELMGGVIVMRDISASKQANEVVEKLFSAVEHTDDTVFITDRKGRIEYVNPAFERVTGYTKKEAIGMTPRILKSGLHTQEEYSHLWATILEGKVYRKTVTNRKKNGEIYHTDQTITPMRDMTKRITNFVTVAKDMTEFLALKQREMNMKVAANVQKRLYPKAPPEVAGLNIAAAVFPAEMTCGDYYDFIPMPDDSLGIVVGDVSGHGVGAAMVMMEARAHLRSLIDAGWTLEDVFARINQYLFDDFEAGIFVTMIFACIEPASGRLTYISAGHDTCYVLDARGEIKYAMVSTGMPLGLVEGSVTRTRVGPRLEEGDVAVLLTDGLSECQAHHGRFLDKEAFLATIRRHLHEPPSAIVSGLRDLVHDFSGGAPLNDDITIVVCKACAPTAGPRTGPRVSNDAD